MLQLLVEHKTCRSCYANTNTHIKASKTCTNSEGSFYEQHFPIIWVQRLFFICFDANCPAMCLQYLFMSLRLVLIT
ncbi:CLUMA_CG009207, isoform A [Clunio marinus]|uniref:CLUMA_CG009207, isoform A n=1 Tax=Clunio marinus TaxID=568069 RepID=A0A1J1I9V7_9DIPT|nr:CLUMA_CG009207, isoform A [Clunio marinus]